MKVIYCAGSISDPNGAQCARNIERGKQWAARIMDAGFAVYSPHSDGGVVGRTSLSLQEVYDMSKAILLKCDAMFVMPLSDSSPGTQGEIAFCGEHGIPVFTQMQELGKWATGERLRAAYGDFEG